MLHRKTIPLSSVLICAIRGEVLLTFLTITGIFTKFEITFAPWIH